MSTPLLVIAHPGHELRIWHWVTLNQPRTFILTDGSGASGQSRLAESEKLLQNAGCQKGDWFGIFTDLDIYNILLQHEAERIVIAVKQLQEAIIKASPAIVVGDMCEGYNPSHDLCRAMIGAATDLATRDQCPPSQNLAFPLTGNPESAWEGRLIPEMTIKLDEAALNDKLSAARGYRPLQHELEAALAKVGKEAFATEAFYHSQVERGYDAIPEDPPFYERYGSEQVALGKYSELISYQDHFLPLIKSMRQILGLEQ
ncbi:MAG: hypothetical protein P1U89_02680 [Verrucomicrobiales bacterium]|nr:hypothetical protein [Verrucomicrobiales bacterium]